MKSKTTDGPICNHCGTSLINKCGSCSAPQCCPKCCQEDTLPYILKRNLALIKLDMDWARSSMPDASDEVRLCALHKARYDCTMIKDELRQESRQWLEERGYKRVYDMEFPPEGLPA